MSTPFQHPSGSPFRSGAGSPSCAAGDGRPVRSRRFPWPNRRPARESLSDRSLVAQPVPFVRVSPRIDLHTNAIRRGQRLDIPLRLATGLFILNSGLSKRDIDKQHAAQLQQMAATALPQFGQMDPERFAMLLSSTEIAVGVRLPGGAREVSVCLLCELDLLGGYRSGPADQSVLLEPAAALADRRLDPAESGGRLISRPGSVAAGARAGGGYWASGQELAEQGPQLPVARLAQRRRKLGLDAVHGLACPLEPLPPRGGEAQRVGAAVARVAAALDQPRSLELVDELHDGGAAEAELGREVPLRGGTARVQDRHGAEVTRLDPQRGQRLLGALARALVREGEQKAGAAGERGRHGRLEI